MLILKKLLERIAEMRRFFSEKRAKGLVIKYRRGWAGKIEF